MAKRIFGAYDMIEISVDVMMKLRIGKSPFYKHPICEMSLDGGRQWAKCASFEDDKDARKFLECRLAAEGEDDCADDGPPHPALRATFPSRGRLQKEADSNG